MSGTGTPTAGPPPVAPPPRPVAPPAPPARVPVTSIRYTNMTDARAYLREQLAPTLPQEFARMQMTQEQQRTALESFNTLVANDAFMNRAVEAGAVRVQSHNGRPVFDMQTFAGLAAQDGDAAIKAAGTTLSNSFSGRASMTVNAPAPPAEATQEAGWTKMLNFAPLLAGLAIGAMTDNLLIGLVIGLIGSVIMGMMGGGQALGNLLGGGPSARREDGSAPALQQDSPARTQTPQPDAPGHQREQPVSTPLPGAAPAGQQQTNIDNARRDALAAAAGVASVSRGAVVPQGPNPPPALAPGLVTTQGAPTPRPVGPARPTPRPSVPAPAEHVRDIQLPVPLVVSPQEDYLVHVTRGNQVYTFVAHNVSGDAMRLSHVLVQNAPGHPPERMPMPDGYFAVGAALERDQTGMLRLNNDKLIGTMGQFDDAITQAQDHGATMTPPRILHTTPAPARRADAPTPIPPAVGDTAQNASQENLGQLSSPLAITGVLPAAIGIIPSGGRTGP